MVLLMIDCENCSDKVIKDILRKAMNTQVIFVVGGNQAEYKYLRLGLMADSVKCNTVGKNAADFVLACALSERIQDKKYESAYILSKDSGFDSVCNYLQSKYGKKVKRIEDADSLVSDGCLEFTGKLIKTFRSGSKYSEILDNSSYEREKTRRSIETLLRLKMAKLKGEKIYFSKRKLEECLYRTQKQVNYLNELHVG